MKDNADDTIVRGSCKSTRFSTEPLVFPRDGGLKIAVEPVELFVFNIDDDDDDDDDDAAEVELLIQIKQILLPQNKYKKATVTWVTFS